MNSSTSILSSYENASVKALLNSSSLLTIDTPTLEPPQQGLTTQGNGTYSTLCPLWSAMPLGIGIPSGTRTFLVSSLLIDMALLI